MSVKAIKAVYHLEISLTPPQSAVLQALAWRTEFDGIITYPTTSDGLAKLVHFNRATVIRAIKALRKLGLSSKPRSGRATIYDLSFIYQPIHKLAQSEPSKRTQFEHQMAQREHQMVQREPADGSSVDSNGTEEDKVDKEDKVEPLRGPTSSSTKRPVLIISAEQQERLAKGHVVELDPLSCPRCNIKKPWRVRVHPAVGKPQCDNCNATLRLTVESATVD